MITGRTKVFGILADPIQHVKTPQEINRLFEQEAVDAVLVPLHVSSDQLKQVVEGLFKIQNFLGVVVTVPHKIAAFGLCDRLVGDAPLIGAVNVIRRDADGALTGAMLDGKGFVAGLKTEGIAVAGMNACLLGAGGAAAAIAFALAEAGVKELTITNRSTSKAEELARRVTARYPTVHVAVGKPETAQRDIIINATSLGLKAGDALPLDDLNFKKEQVVSDIIMDPVETPFLAAARACGARIHPGLPMLQSQIRLMAQHMAALLGPDNVDRQ